MNYAVPSPDTWPLRQKFAAIRSVLVNWPLAIADRVGHGNHTFHTRSGSQVICRSRTTDLSEVIVVLSGAEYPEHLLRVSDGDVVMDLGANIGAFAIFLESLNRDTTFSGIAFEPFADNFDVLSKNLQLNRSKFTARRLAITGHDGAVRLDATGGHDAVAVTSSATGIASACARLSTACESSGVSRVALLKMDIEGSEYAVIEADSEYLAGHVERILMEYHVMPDGRGAGWIRDRLGSHFDIDEVHRSSGTGVLHLRNRSLPGSVGLA